MVPLVFRLATGVNNVYYVYNIVSVYIPDCFKLDTVKECDKTGNCTQKYDVEKFLQMHNKSINFDRLVLTHFDVQMYVKVCAITSRVCPQSSCQFSRSTSVNLSSQKSIVIFERLIKRFSSCELMDKC